MYMSDEQKDKKEEGKWTPVSRTHRGLLLMPCEWEEHLAREALLQTEDSIASPPWQTRHDRGVQQCAKECLMLLN